MWRKALLIGRWLLPYIRNAAPVTLVLGLTALLCATLFHGNMSWWTAGAVGWFVGEATLLLSRLWLLYSQKKHVGVPMGMIFSSAAALLLMVVFLR